jgi:hypothetical protein
MKRKRKDKDESPLTNSELRGITYTGKINNAIRAELGKLAVETGSGDPPAEIAADLVACVTDVLANLMHFCKREGYIDFQQCLDSAEINFDDESCNTPGCTYDANDGEGFDGFCGNCADKKEAASA